MSQAKPALQVVEHPPPLDVVVELEDVLVVVPVEEVEVEEEVELVAPLVVPELEEVEEPVVDVAELEVDVGVPLLPLPLEVVVPDAVEVGAEVQKPELKHT